MDFEVNHIGFNKHADRAQESRYPSRWVGMLLGASPLASLIAIKQNNWMAQAEAKPGTRFGQPRMHQAA